jgi:ATP-dependent DNA helicase PIF1
MHQRSTPPPGYGAILDGIVLDEHQQDALDRVLRGESVFITGGAGAGKTFVVRCVVDALKERLGDDYEERVVVTAATGVAAVVAGGCTLHHSCGVRVPRLVKDFEVMQRSRYCSSAWWRRLEVLVIDEISMISGEFLDHLEAQVRRLRGRDELFGGLQVVLVGDPFQLAPIPPSFVGIRGLDVDEANNRALVRSKSGGESDLFLNRGMFFQSDAYWDHGFKVVELACPHRQDGQGEYYKALNELRHGCSGNAKTFKSIVRFFNKRIRKNASDDGAVHMFSNIRPMQQMNEARLDELPSQLAVFEAVDDVVLDGETSGANADYFEKLLRSSDFFDDRSTDCPVLRSVRLKEGARVMLLANMRYLHKGLVNGLCGTVVGLAPQGVRDRHREEAWVEVDFDDLGPIIIPQWRFRAQIPGLGWCSRLQIPLQLAWAITTHRSQGKTLSSVRVDPRAFSEGLLYVALSRTPSLEGLELAKAIGYKNALVSKDAVAFMEHHEDPLRARELLGTWRDQPLPPGLLRAWRS